LKRRSWLWGREITVIGGGREIAGTVVDIGPEGELVVEASNGDRESVVSAERVLFSV